MFLKKIIEAPSSTIIGTALVLGLFTLLFTYTHYRHPLSNTIANVTHRKMAHSMAHNALLLNTVILIAHSINLFFYITLFLPIKGIEILYEKVSSASKRFKRLPMDPRLLILRLLHAPAKAFAMVLDYAEYTLIFLPLMIMDWLVCTYWESDSHWSRNSYTGFIKALLIPVWMVVLLVNVFFYCFLFVPVMVLERVWGFFFEEVYEDDLPRGPLFALPMLGQPLAPKLRPMVTSPVTPKDVNFVELPEHAAIDTDRTIVPTTRHRKLSLIKSEAISELDLNEGKQEQYRMKETREEICARIKLWRDIAMGLVVDTSAVDDESASRRSIDSAIMVESPGDGRIAAESDKHDAGDSAVDIMSPVEHEHDFASGLVGAADWEDHLHILEADEESDNGGDPEGVQDTDEHYFEFGLEDGPDVVERMVPGRMEETMANEDIEKNTG